MSQVMKQTHRRSRACGGALSAFARGERGAGALVAVMAVLVLGALILVPLLVYMITGQRAGSSTEERTSEFYSADAGVEYAISWLQNDIPEGTKPGWDYRELDEFTVNYDTVAVRIDNEYSEGAVFRITSTATDIATGKTTTVVARVTPITGFQGDFFGNAITSKEDVTLMNQETIYGNVVCSGLFQLAPNCTIHGDVTCGTIDNAGTIYGNLTCVSAAGKGVGKVIGTVKWVSAPPDLESTWPTYCELDAFYSNENETFPEIIPASISTHGPWHGRTESSFEICGPPPADTNHPGSVPGSLTIDLKTAGVIVELDGNILVTGDLVMEGSKGELDLNGKTIYVRGEVYVEPGAKITGAGLVIAIGNVNAQPTLSAGGSKYSAAVVYYDGNSNPTNGTWSSKSITETYLFDLNDVWGVSSEGYDTVYAVGNGSEVQYYSGPAHGTVAWQEIDISGYVPPQPNLNGVWSMEGSTLYAVGSGGYVVTYDGSTWKYSAETTANLNAVWGTSDNSIYAVGDGGTILHYDGDDWSGMGVGVTSANLNGVWGTSDNVVFAVGDAGTILRYDGTAWSKLPIVAVETNHNLRAVWGDSSSSFFAVGDGGTILGYNGVKWPAMSSGTTVNLRDVCGTSDGTVFVVGESDVDDMTGMQLPAVALKWTAGDGWVGMTMDPGVTRDLNGVWGGAWNDVYAVGATRSNFMFFLSTDGAIDLKPAKNGQFIGGIAGGSDIKLLSNQTLAPSGDTGEPSFPKYRYMVIETYVISGTV